MSYADPRKLDKITLRNCYAILRPKHLETASKLYPSSFSDWPARVASNFGSAWPVSSSLKRSPSLNIQPPHCHGHAPARGASRGWLSHRLLIRSALSGVFVQPLPLLKLDNHLRTRPRLFTWNRLDRAHRITRTGRPGSGPKNLSNMDISSPWRTTSPRYPVLTVTPPR